MGRLYPELKIDLEKIRHNTRETVKRCEERGIRKRALAALGDAPHGARSGDLSPRECGMEEAFDTHIIINF